MSTTAQHHPPCDTHGCATGGSMNATRKYHTGAHAGSPTFSGGGWNIKELARNGLRGQSEVEAWRRHACVANSSAPPSSRSAPQPAEKHTHTHTHARTCTRAHTHGHQVLSALGGRSLPERSTTMFRWTPTVPKSWATAHGAPSQPTNGQQTSHSQPANKHTGRECRRHWTVEQMRSR